MMENHIAYLIQRYAKTFREKGSDWFFHREEKRGSCHKLDDQAMDKAWLCDSPPE